MEMYFVCEQACKCPILVQGLDVLLNYWYLENKYTNVGYPFLQINNLTNNVYKLEQFKTKHSANSLPFVINHILKLGLV